MLPALLSILFLASAVNFSKKSPAFPNGCETYPRSITISDFYWHNATHNLDCVNEDPSAYPCLNSTQGVCDPGPDPNNRAPGCPNCIPACYTGIPSYQPAGYGPPDHVSYSIQTAGPVSGRQCVEENPQSIRRREVGNGIVMCGGAGTYSMFVGDSTASQGNNGTISWQYQTQCGNAMEKYFALSYQAVFPLVCSRDGGGKATCSAGAPVVATCTGF